MGERCFFRAPCLFIDDVVSQKLGTKWKSNWGIVIYLHASFQSEDKVGWVWVKTPKAFSDRALAPTEQPWGNVSQSWRKLRLAHFPGKHIVKTSISMMNAFGLVRQQLCKTGPLLFPITRYFYCILSYPSYITSTELPLAYGHGCGRSFEKVQNRSWLANSGNSDSWVKSCSPDKAWIYVEDWTCLCLTSAYPSTFSVSLINGLAHRESAVQVFVFTRCIPRLITNVYILIDQSIIDSPKIVTGLLSQYKNRSIDR